MFIKLECVICHKPFSADFYDVGDQGRCDNGGNRYLCSRACRDIWYKKCEDGYILDLQQKLAQRKRCLDYYYQHQEAYKTKYKNRYAKSIGLAGAI
jgi:hypothetical protein